jgi:hypothetical protein
VLGTRLKKAQSIGLMFDEVSKPNYPSTFEHSKGLLDDADDPTYDGNNEDADDDDDDE